MKSSSTTRSVIFVSALLALAGSAHAATCEIGTERVVVTSGTGACEACPTGTVTGRAAGDDTTGGGTPADTFCGHIKAGYSGTKGANAAADGTGTTADATSVVACLANKYAIGVSAEDRTCTDCPQGFDTNGVTGASARETCEKSYTADPTGTEATDVFLATTGASSSNAVTLNACPEGTVAETAVSGLKFDDSASNTATKCSVVAFDYYGTAGSATTHASSVTACPANSNSAAGSTVIGDCKCDSGFKATANSGCTGCTSDTNWITAPSVSASTATVCSAADANYYVSTAATTTNDATVTACPSNSVTNAGATALSECVVPGGRYLQTASTTSGSVATQTAPDGWYATGGASVTDTTMQVGVANTALVATTDYSAKNLFKCPKKTINGVEFSSTTDVSNNGAAGSVEECFFDVDYATARQLIATETTGLYVMETSLQSSLLRLGVCPEGTVGNAFTFDQLLANQALKAAQEKTFCHITLAGYYGTQGDEGEHHALAKPCPAGQSSAQGAESCTSAAAATPAAADSAGAAMPIAAAVAAMAMPLLI